MFGFVDSGHAHTAHDDSKFDREPLLIRSIVSDQCGKLERVEQKLIVLLLFQGNLLESL